MKIFILFVCLCISLFAQEQKLSTLAPTSSVFIDLEEGICDNTCLHELLQSQQIFSFLSKFNRKNADTIAFDTYNAFRTLLRINETDNINIRIAMLIPQKSIRRYAITTVNSAISYLLLQDANFELKVFNSIDEQKNSLQTAITQIKNEGFLYVIAPLTQQGVQIVSNEHQNLLFFIPTINRSKFPQASANLFFGGIDYEKQIDLLLSRSNKKIAIFKDGSELGEELSQIIAQKNPQIVLEQSLENPKTDFKKMLKTNMKLDDSAVFFNTPLVKTSLLASQFRFYDRLPAVLLSTQINYNPLLLTLTQYEDRKQLYIANSITQVPNNIEDINSLLGHSITYDWVNYASSIGVDFFYSNYLDPTTNSVFHERIFANQVEYDIAIMQAKRYKFEAVLP
ncbi:MAG: hypothetical protein IBX44_00915 [Sulfurospirillum sp.]|nr:hypothetical protein [Sulfurospirillum sp.]